MKKSFTFLVGIILFFLLIIVGAIFFIFLREGSAVSRGDDDSPPPHETTLAYTKEIYDATSGIVMKTYDVKGMSMEPTIENGDEVTVDLSHYTSGEHLIAHGDIIIFENPHSHDRVIKRVGILPGDRVVKDIEKKTLLVNGKILVNSLSLPYTFDNTAYKWVDIYTKNGTIIDNTYFLYGDNISGSLDSRVTGPVTLEGIIGKVIEIREKDEHKKE